MPDYTVRYVNRIDVQGLMVEYANEGLRDGQFNSLKNILEAWGVDCTSGNVTKINYFTIVPEDAEAEKVIERAF